MHLKYSYKNSQALTYPVEESIADFPVLLSSFFPLVLNIAGGLIGLV